MDLFTLPPMNFRFTSLRHSLLETLPLGGGVVIKTIAIWGQVEGGGGQNILVEIQSGQEGFCFALHINGDLVYMHHQDSIPFHIYVDQYLYTILIHEMIQLRLD